MELTQEKIDELMDDMLKIAKTIRATIPYSRTDAFPQTVIMLGPELQPATVPITWKSEPEKYMKMRAVSETAMEMFCQAVILISDVRWVETEKAEKLLGLPPLAEVGLEKWGEMYKREITTRYKGYLGNAPAELYTEAIIAVMKGPRLNQIPMRAAPYQKGDRDSIHWLPSKNTTYGPLHFNLLPDWWC